MLFSVKNILLIGTLAVTTVGCQKAKMIHNQGTPEAVTTLNDDGNPVVEPLPPAGPPIVTVPLDPRFPQQPPTTPTPAPPAPNRPQDETTETVPYTDINNRPERHPVYDCPNDCEPRTPAPAPTPAPTPKPVAETPVDHTPAYEEVCYVTDFIQPDPQQVDILVVVDSAGANFDRSDLTAKAIAAYVNSHLRRERHVRLGILPAHGSRSEFSGRLFQPLPTTVSTASDVEDLDLESMGLSDEALEYMQNGNPSMQGKDVSNPVVLDSLELELTNNNFEFFARTNIGFMPEDIYSDGGQSGLYSLYRALTTNFSEVKSQGLFRDGATQHILFVSNEADICAASFEDPTPERGARSKPMDTEFPDLTREQAARIRDCEQTSFEQQDLVRRIQELQQDHALTVSALVPTDRSKFTSLHPFSSEETEVGSGYIEVARQTGGHVYDLFDVEASQNGLNRLASTLGDQFETGLARHSLTSEFRLEYQGHLASVTPIVMDKIYDEALLSQNLPEECLTLSEYNSRCPNMTMAGYTLSAEKSAGGQRNTSTVRLQDAGKFGSKIQINFCSSVLK